jgi:isopenicillin N synthase-like dioxygenase
MSDALPVIDLSGLASGETAALDRVAGEIGAACRTVGFFYVVNHGVAPALMSEAFRRSTEFFAASNASKEALAIERVGGNRGYSGLKHEALNPKLGADLKEAFNIGLELAADDPEIVARAPFRTLNVWPQQPQFRTTMLAYFDACAALARAIHRAIARDLALPPDYFAAKLDRPMATLRLLHYPASQGEGEIGAGEHTDYGNITLLATDEVGGLEAHRRDGAWVAAPPMSGAFIVNIGDCLMRWTNDVYVSTPHRVVNRSGRERYSIAFFFDPNPEAQVEAIPSCIPPGERARYAPILAADYLKMRLDASKPAAM